MREKYTALWPVPVILSTLVFNDSLSTTPTLALAPGQAKQTKVIARPHDNSPAASIPLVRSFVGTKNFGAKTSLNKTDSPQFSKTDKSPIVLP
jgi:hypothetical protein